MCYIVDLVTMRRCNHHFKCYNSVWVFKPFKYTGFNIGYFHEKKEK